MVNLKIYEETSNKIVDVTCYNCETVHVIDLTRWDQKHFHNLYEKCNSCNYVFSFDVEIKYITRSFACLHLN